MVFSYCRFWYFWIVREIFLARSTCGAPCGVSATHASALLRPVSDPLRSCTMKALLAPPCLPKGQRAKSSHCSLLHKVRANCCAPYESWAKCLHCVRTASALRVHCVRTACILRTQRLGYSPKNTCHLFNRGKSERCQYHRVGQVSIDTSGCSYNQQHRRRRTVRSWCQLATIEYRRSRAFERR